MVLGSDAINAPATVRSTAASRGAPPHAAPTRSRVPAAKPVAVAAPPPTSETIYAGDETVWNPKQQSVPLPWKKIGVAAGIMLLLLLGIGIISNRSARHGTQAASTNDPEEDALIKQQIEDAFSGSDSLKNQKIEVAVRGGGVTLSGHVARAYESEIANDLAKDVSGVQSVKNDIQVQEAQEEREPVWRSQAKNSNSSPSAGISASGVNTNGAQSNGSVAQRTQLQKMQQIPAQQLQNVLDPATRAQVQEFNQRGYKRLRSGDYAGAEKAFRNALKLAPNNPLAQQGLRRAQLRQAGQLQR